MHFQKVAVVGHRVNQIEHVVRLIRRRGHETIEGRILPVGRIAGPRSRGSGALGASSRLFDGRNDSSSRIEREAFAVVVDGEVRDAARRVMGRGAAELLFGDFLVRHRLQHVGPGHEHVARVPDHDREIGDGRRVDRAARARAHDRGNLRHDARRQRVPQKNIGVTGEREHAFLNARAARIVQADDGRADLDRQIHDLHDLGGVGFRERSAEDREVLREREHLPPVDQSVAGDDAVAGDDLILHPEIAAPVRDQLVDFFERAGIEQQIRSARGRSACRPRAAARREPRRRRAPPGAPDRRECLRDPTPTP